MDNGHDEGLVDVLGLRHHGHGHRHDHRRKRSAASCLVALLVLALVVGAVAVGVTKGFLWVKDQFGDPEDYAGPGVGRVTVEVHEGETSTDIARTLKAKDVIASVEAFIDAAKRRSQEAAGIQVGFYELQKKMKANDALSILVDPANLVQTVVTIPEGMRVVDIVAILDKKTRFKKAQFERALDNTKTLGLPSYAKGNPEGYLFPATYNFSPTDTPRSMLRKMVDRWHEAAEEADLVKAAEDLGLTPGELMTVASLVEAESGPKYAAKAARVIYNRLEDESATNGKLELDATVNYAHGRNLGARTSDADREIDSPYNTYQVPGLPPGPIEAPGLAAIEAAAHPAEGDWLYYVTINLRTGETAFADTYPEHLRNVEKLNEYCRTESERC